MSGRASRAANDKEIFPFGRLASIQRRCLVTIQFDSHLAETSTYKQLAQLGVGIETKTVLREGILGHLFRGPCDEEEIATGP